MKNTFAQVQFLAAKIDRRYIQFAYFVFVLVSFVYSQTPTDGGVGPR